MTPFVAVLGLVAMVVGAVPTFFATRRGVVLMGALGGLVPGLAWIIRSLAGNDIDRLFAGFVAFVITAAWMCGLAVGMAGVFGTRRGWRIARFPARTAISVLIVGGLYLTLVLRS